MPFLRSDGDVMYQREFDSKKRLIEDNRKRVEKSTSTTSS